MHAWLIAALVVSWAFTGILLFLLFLLIKEQGELRMYQMDQDHRLEISATHAGADYARNPPQAPEQQGLPVGVDAPAFALKDLQGKARSSEEFRGSPYVIAFFSTSCGFCLDMAPALGRLGDGHPLVLVTHGEVKANQRLAKEHGWQCETLIEPEEDWDVMISYQAMGTPSGYLIDEEGKIASPVALGADAILALRTTPPEELSVNGHGDPLGVRIGLSGPLPDDDEGETESQAATATATAVKTRDVAESNIVRDGLKAGTPAPNFVLPDLEGKGHSLGDYRGKRVLLVFSDVDCAPCEQMAPDLVKLYEKRPKDLEIVMISRGDVEANRLKATVHGYPFPILIQRGWEISKLYGMFATPIGYLIDGDGVIAKDVAVGAEPILDLV